MKEEEKKPSREDALKKFIRKKGLVGVSRSEVLLRMFVQHLEEIAETSAKTDAVKGDDLEELRLGHELIRAYFPVLLQKAVYGKDFWPDARPEMYAEAMHHVITGAFLIGSRGTITKSAKRTGTMNATRMHLRNRETQVEIVRGHYEAAEKAANGRLKKGQLSDVLEKVGRDLPLGEERIKDLIELVRKGANSPTK